VNARPRRGARPVAAPSGEATQKLHKILAQAGLGSRRTMEEWIRAGRVSVNGAAAGIGTRVTSRDVIRVGRRVVRWPAPQRLPRIVLYHKPEGEIVSRDDPQERSSVFDGMPRIRGGKWLAVGRLDYNTGGLLVFTTSGELANRMMHPRFGLEREYAVRLLGQLSPDRIDQLRTGVELDDGVARCLAVEDGGGEGRNHWYRIVLAEGRNRIVRRMFEALGMTVSRLMRVRFGSLRLPPRLKRGQWREMAPEEVGEFLRSLNPPAGKPRDHRG
jgi:23S rRNA pseudouridine2605 synthase